MLCRCKVQVCKSTTTDIDFTALSSGRDSLMIDQVVLVPAAVDSRSSCGRERGRLQGLRSRQHGHGDIGPCRLN